MQEGDLNAVQGRHRPERELRVVHVRRKGLPGRTAPHVQLTPRPRDLRLRWHLVTDLSREFRTLPVPFGGVDPCLHRQFTASTCGTDDGEPRNGLPLRHASSPSHRRHDPDRVPGRVGEVHNLPRPAIRCRAREERAVVIERCEVERRQRTKRRGGHEEPDAHQVKEAIRGKPGGRYKAGVPIRFERRVPVRLAHTCEEKPVRFVARPFLGKHPIRRTVRGSHPRLRRQESTDRSRVANLRDRLRRVECPCDCPQINGEERHECRLPHDPPGAKTIPQGEDDHNGHEDPDLPGNLRLGQVKRRKGKLVELLDIEARVEASHHHEVALQERDRLILVVRRVCPDVRKRGRSRDRDDLSQPKKQGEPEASRSRDPSAVRVARLVECPLTTKRIGTERREYRKAECRQEDEPARGTQRRKPGQLRHGAMSIERRVFADRQRECDDRHRPEVPAGARPAESQPERCQAEGGQADIPEHFPP